MRADHVPPAFAGGGRALHVDVTVRGDVAPGLARRAAERVAELEHTTTAPILDARVVLTQERNPRISLPARAEGRLLLAGDPVRASVAAPAMRAAIDQLAERLHDQIRRYVDRLTTDHHRPAGAVPGEWRHRAWTPPRAARPPGERRVVRRKAYALEPTTAIAAVQDLMALDHRFYLFRDRDTDADAVVYHRDDGRIAVLQPADAPRREDERDLPREPSRFTEPIDESVALAEMDALTHRFLYFINAATGRGCVVYLRHDGHYGLLEPAG